MTHAMQNFRTVNQLLNELFDAGKSVNSNVNQGFVKSNIHETTDGYHIELLVAGVPKNEVKIAIDKQLLTISYEAKENTSADAYKTIQREFLVRSFQKSFRLTDKISIEGIKAAQENGILKVYLPKTQEAVFEPKSIEIE